MCHADMCTYLYACFRPLQQFELLASGNPAADPSLFAPSTCHEAVAKKLTEQAGGTFSRATGPEDAPEPEVASAAVHVRTVGSLLGVGAAAIGWLLLPL